MTASQEVGTLACGFCQKERGFIRLQAGSPGDPTGHRLSVCSSCSFLQDSEPCVSFMFLNCSPCLLVPTSYNLYTGCYCQYSSILACALQGQGLGVSLGSDVTVAVSLLWRLHRYPGPYGFRSLPETWRLWSLLTKTSGG